jgi:hypothetical protein
MVERLEFLSFTGKMKNVRHTQLVETHVGRKHLGGCRLKWGNSIKYVKFEDVDWINQAHDRIQWWE